jgi:CubicO group peptidase (beta-lactamase class C family)
MLVVALGCTTDDGAGPPAKPPTFDCDGHVVGPMQRWSEAGFDGALAFSSPSSDGLCAAGGDTAYDIGSVTKTVTATAVLSLVERGTISLDDTAGRWLPELPDPVAAVTVDQLLTHTAGLGPAHAPDEQPMSLDEALAVIGSQPLLFEPGEGVSYSNSGYTLLAATVERASGRPFRDELAAEVLTLPDGSVAGGFWDDGLPATAHWALEGAGGVAMSAGQLHDWTMALASGGIIGQESLDLMTEPRVETDDGPLTYGWVSLDAEVLGEPGFMSVGGGGSTGHEVALFWSPGGPLVVLASSGPGIRAEDLASAVVPALASGDEVPPPVASVTGDPADLVALAGSYRLDDGGEVRITAEGTHLTALATDGAALPALFPAPADLGADAVAEHERMVGDLMDGTATNGRDEVELMRAELGFTSWRTLGTAFIEGELRTYIGLATGDAGEVVAWLALDELGGVAGVEYEATSPSRRLVEVAGATFVPAETVEDADPEVTLTFTGGDEVTLTSDATTVTAARA